MFVCVYVCTYPCTCFTFISLLIILIWCVCVRVCLCVRVCVKANLTAIKPFSGKCFVFIFPFHCSASHLLGPLSVFIASGVILLMRVRVRVCVCVDV